MSNVRRKVTKSVRIAIIGAASVGLIVAAASLTSSEVITVQALTTVSLYDPGSMAGPWGTKLKVVGTLQPGESLNVVGCNDRKSDIDLQVNFHGHIAVLGGGAGEYQLHRRKARPWEENAITSCFGFFSKLDASA